MMTILTNNQEIRNFISSISAQDVFFAVKTKSKIEVFKNKKSFNKVAKTNPNAVQGEFTAYNFHLYYFPNSKK